jgi:ATP-binding cassette subfamily C protein CydCD
MLVAAGVGLVGELAALGLLTTGAWLLLSASLRPPILLLSIAIGAVQLFSFLRGTARYVERLASHSLGLSLQAGLRAWLYRRLAHLVPCGLPGGDRGDLLTRLIRDTEEAQDLVVRAAVPVLAAAAAWAAAVVTAVALLPPAGWAILAAGILAAAGIAVAVILADRTAVELPAARGAVASWVLGTLTAREELVALGAGEWALDQLAERERVLGARTRAAAAAGLGRAACALAGGAGLTGVAWTGAAALRAARIGPVELGVLVFLALGVAAVFQGLPDAVGRLPVSLASLTRLASLGSLPRPGPGLSEDHPAPQPRPAPGARRTATVALRGAAAAYPNCPGPVLRDLNLELAPGRPVALAGPSGSGKTLVVLTLLRFLDLTAGNLSIDGTDARACSPGEVRALLAWSPEQPTLFPTSLRVNLRVGAPHATDRQITDLLRQLCLGPWLDRLEQGLDTVLAPWDHPVSGGELQRLSVARAVLADRPVLLLDEPTRHLDAATADAVLQAVLERAADRSLLWITHRPEELAAFPEVHHLDADPLSASDRPPDRWPRGPGPESAASWPGSPGLRGARR